MLNDYTLITYMTWHQ